MIQSKTERKINKSEESLGDLLDNTKSSGVRIIAVPAREVKAQTGMTTSQI